MARFHTELRELWKLAAPLAAVQAGIQLMAFVDTAIVGRLGAAALGGVGLASAIFFAFTILGQGVVMGLDPLVAQALGAGEPARARALFWQAIWLSLLVSVAMAIPVLAAVPLLEPLGIGPDVAAQARPYLLVRVLGLPPFLVFVGARSYLQALGRTRPMLLAMVAGNLLNVALALLLVFGGAGLPHWTGPLRDVPGFGVAGAAAATTICTVLQVAVVALAIRSERVAGFLPAWRRARRADLKKALDVGMPIGLQMGAEVGIFTLVAVLAGKLGADAVAAHQIALMLASLSFTVSLGIGAAGSVRVGRAVGAGDTRQARRAGLVAFASGAAFMSLSAACFWLFPYPLARLLTDKPEVLAVAVPLVGVAALFQISDGTQAVGAGVLRGAGDTRVPFIVNLVGHYAVGLPVAVGLGLLGGLGVIGLWWGLCAGLTAVAVSLLARFLVLSRRPIHRLAVETADTISRP